MPKQLILPAPQNWRGYPGQIFLPRLQEHFQFGYIIADKVVSEDLETVVKFDRKRK